jgi:hypothetical protein
MYNPSSIKPPPVAGYSLRVGKRIRPGRILDYRGSQLAALLSLR